MNSEPDPADRIAAIRQAWAAEMASLITVLYVAGYMDDAISGLDDGGLAYRYARMAGHFARIALGEDLLAALLRVSTDLQNIRAVTKTTGKVQNGVADDVACVRGLQERIKFTESFESLQFQLLRVSTERDQALCAAVGALDIAARDDHAYADWDAAKWAVFNAAVRYVKNLPRVEPFHPCVETTRSTAEQSSGAVTAAERTEKA